MPNWTYNIVTPDDDAAREFLKENCLDDDGNFTFNKMLPTPEIFNILASPTRIVSGPDDDKLRDYVIPEEYKYLTENGIYVITPGMVSFYTEDARDEIVERYGYDCWYSWRNAKWGTKWDATHHDNDGDSYRFETAWSEPFGVMREIAKLMPNGSSIGWVAEDEEGSVDTYLLTKGKVHLESHEDAPMDEEYYGDEEM